MRVPLGLLQAGGKKSNERGLRSLPSANQTESTVEMKRLMYVSMTVVSVFGLMLATERRAMAYVDPGSGLLAIQSIGSMLAAAGFFLRRHIMGIFTKKKPLTRAALPVTVRKEDSRNAA
jgi:hypothetical protein